MLVSSVSLFILETNSYMSNTIIINQIFEFYKNNVVEDEKEPEMQIGKPTDVKHVAHIGWEGPSATTPSWVYNLHLSQ